MPRVVARSRPPPDRPTRPRSYTPRVRVVGGLVIAIAALAWLRPRPQRGVLALAALVPFHGLLLFVPDGARLAGWKEALVAATVVAALTAPAGARRSVAGTMPPWGPPLALLVVAAALSLPAADRAEWPTGAKVMFFYALLAAVQWRCPLDRRERDRLVTILMVTGVVTAVVGIGQQVVGPDRLAALGLEWGTALRTTGGRFRSISTFAQPFPFAFFVTLVLLVGGSVALADPHRRRNRLFLWAAPVLVAGLLTAFVRGAIVGLAAGALYLAVTRHRALVHGAVAALVVALLLPVGLWRVLTSTSSLEARRDGWAHTVGLIVERPFGWGLGSVGSAAEKVHPDAVGAESFGFERWALPYHPDNQYVSTGLQVGVLGVWAMALLVVAAFRHARHRARNAAGADAALAQGIAAIVVAAGVAALVASYWEIFPLDAYFWLLVGALPSIDRVSPSTPWPSVPAGAASRPTSATSSVGSPV